MATFQIHRADFPAFVSWESFFRVTPVAVEEPPEFPWTAAERAAHALSPLCYMCLRFSNETELVATNFACRDEFDALVRPWYAGDLFRKDILPCRVYLKHCVTAAERLAPAVLHNFLSTTYLADGVTTIGAYLARHPDLFETVVLGQFDRYQG